MGGELGFPAGKTPDFARAPRLFSFVFGGPVIEKADYFPFCSHFKKFLDGYRKEDYDLVVKSIIMSCINIKTL